MAWAASCGGEAARGGASGGDLGGPGGGEGERRVQQGVAAAESCARELRRLGCGLATEHLSIIAVQYISFHLRRESDREIWGIDCLMARFIIIRPSFARHAVVSKTSGAEGGRGRGGGCAEMGGAAVWVGVIVAAAGLGCAEGRFGRANGGGPARGAPWLRLHLLGACSALAVLLASLWRGGYRRWGWRGRHGCTSF